VSDENRDEQGEAVPLNWAYTNCGYRVEGELPEECPQCGASKRAAGSCRMLDANFREFLFYELR
jgi:hypothetical protein